MFYHDFKRGCNFEVQERRIVSETMGRIVESLQEIEQKKILSHAKYLKNDTKARCRLPGKLSRYKGCPETGAHLSRVTCNAICRNSDETHVFCSALPFQQAPAVVCMSNRSRVTSAFVKTVAYTLQKSLLLTTQACCGDPGEGGAVLVGPIWCACVAKHPVKHRSLQKEKRKFSSQLP